ncbi:MAG TPA: hypothetical protein VEP50_19185 [bacterium]|nr:hypothetical protein [bacterium]
MSEDRYQLDFQGFLRTEDGQYVKSDDFLAFVAGAATAKPGVSDKDRALTWLRRQGMKGKIEDPLLAEVSRLVAAAQKVILVKRGRVQRGLVAEPDIDMPPEEAV